MFSKTFDKRCNDLSRKMCQGQLGGKVKNEEDEMPKRQLPNLLVKSSSLSLRLRVNPYLLVFFEYHFRDVRRKTSLLHK